MNKAVSQFHANLANHREQLEAEETRLAAELAEIRASLAGIDRLSGKTDEGLSSGPKHGEPQITGSFFCTRAELRLEIVRHLMAAHPSGLTSETLFQRISAEHPRWDVSTRKIGANFPHMPEVVGDGLEWYYVPADPAPTTLEPGAQVI